MLAPGARDAGLAKVSDTNTAIFVEVARFPDRERAADRAFVLAAVGIRCHLAPQADCTALTVPLADAPRAREHLDAYARENAPAPPRAHRPEIGRHGLETALGVDAVLAFLFAADHRFLFGVAWLQAGAADASAILDGEVWRLVTALGLHGDGRHLLGNLAFGTVAWAMLAGVLGTGAAWLATLAAGALGNLVSALLHGPAHVAVGASTAVFGALGLLAGLAGRRRMAAREPTRVRRWAPLAAGVMLLTFLGVTGERTDILAHIGGFAVGAALGLAGGRIPGETLARRGIQPAAGGAAALVFAACWAVALRA